MTFGDDVTAGMVELRGHALTAMKDLVLIERKTGSVPDPDTLQEVDVFEPIYEGKCKVKSATIQASNQNAGDAQFDIGAAVIAIPASAALIKGDDRATITGAPFDPDNVGRVFTVRQNMPRTFEVQQRLFCQEVT